jgi:hypothetical protein
MVIVTATATATSHICVWALASPILLALNTMIRPNWTIGAPVKRSLIAYDHRPPPPAANSRSTT